MKLPWDATNRIDRRRNALRVGAAPDSLLVAMLMHASLRASTLILGPLAISGVPLLIYDLVLAATLWVVVAAVAVADGGQLSRQLLRGRWLEGFALIRRTCGSLD